MERRSFLKMLGAGAVAVAAPKPPVHPPAPEPVVATLEEMDGVPWTPPTFSSTDRWDGTYGLVACTSASFDSVWNDRVDRILVDTGWSEVES